MKIESGVELMVSVSDLEADPNQPRKSFDIAGLKSLGESMRVRMEVPIEFRLDRGKKIIVDGERRWRAAKLVKIPKVRCLLRADATDPKSIAATQLTTAAQRESLRPIEIGEFLLDLRTRVKLSTNQMLADLTKLGIRDVGPVKLENYIELTNLPKWAKDRLRDGTLQETHGTILLGGNKYPDVMKYLAKEVEQQINFAGSITTKGMQELLTEAIDDVGTDLNQTWGQPKEVRQFDIKVCNGCEFKKAIGRRTFCMNRAEFDKKNAAALLVKADKEARKSSAEKGGATGPETDPTKVKPREFMVSRGKVVDISRLRHDTYKTLDQGEFDKTQCLKCPHNKKAAHGGDAKEGEATCFHMPCFDLKSKSGRRMEGRTQKMRDYFDAWLRPHVLEQFHGKLGSQEILAVVYWMASGAPAYGGDQYINQAEGQVATSVRKFLRSEKLMSLPAVYDFTTAKGEHLSRQQAFEKGIVTAAVQVMSQRQLRYAAHLIKFDLEKVGPTFRVDDAYLQQKRKGEMAEMAKSIGVESIAGLGVDELRKYLLTENAGAYREAIGVPADIRAIYEEAFVRDEGEYGNNTSHFMDDDSLDDEPADDDEPKDGQAIAESSIIGDILKKASATKKSRVKKAA